MGSVRACAGWISERGVPALLTTITGAQSFSHIRDLALSHGQGAWQADTYPVAVDAVTVYAMGKMLDPDVPRRTRGFAWLVFLAFCVVSLAANLLDSPVHDATGYFTAVLPSASFLSVTVLAHFSAHRKAAAQTQQEPQEQTQEAIPVTSKRPVKNPPTSSRNVVAQQLRERARDFKRAHPDAKASEYVTDATAWLLSQGHGQRSPGTLRNIFGAVTV